MYDLKPEDQKVVDEIFAQSRAEAEAEATPKPPESDKPSEVSTEEKETVEAATAQPKTETEATSKEPEKEPAQDNSGSVKAALRASRQAERRAKQEIDRLKQELEAAKSGKGTSTNELSEEEIAEQERDFPLLAKQARENKELKERLARLEQSLAPKVFEPIQFSVPEVQDAIDATPELLALQLDPDAQDQFEKAFEIDARLVEMDEWKHRPITERLAEVVKQLKAPSKPPKRDPSEVIASAPVEQPTRIGQMHGGAAPNKTTPDFSRMTNEEIFATLRAESE